MMRPLEILIWAALIGLGYSLLQIILMVAQHLCLNKMDEWRKTETGDGKTIINE